MSLAGIAGAVGSGVGGVAGVGGRGVGGVAGVGGPGVGAVGGVGGRGVGGVAGVGGGGVGAVGGAGRPGVGGGGYGGGPGTGGVGGAATGGMVGPGWSANRATKAAAYQTRENEDVARMNTFLGSLLGLAPDSKLAQALSERGPLSLGKLLAGEALGEGIPGMTAVAGTLVNRALAQQSKQGMNFLGNNKNLSGMYNALAAPNAATDVTVPGSPAYNAAAIAAALGLNLTPGNINTSDIPANVLNSTHYHAGYVTPGWSKKDFTKFGDHLFGNPEANLPGGFIAQLRGDAANRLGRMGGVGDRGHGGGAR